MNRKSLVERLTKGGFVCYKPQNRGSIVSAKSDRLHVTVWFSRDTRRGHWHLSRIHAWLRTPVFVRDPHGTGNTVRANGGELAREFSAVKEFSRLFPETVVHMSGQHCVAFQNGAMLRTRGPAF